jgi:Trk K+ transport system NAD-binding subunit
LKKIGATDVVFPSREAGAHVGNIIVARKSHARVKDVIEFDPSISYRIEEISISKHLEGKTLGSLNLEANYGVKILFVKTIEKKNVKKNGKILEEETVARHLRPFDQILGTNDSIVVAGEEENIGRLKREIGEKDIVGEGFSPAIR